MSEANRKTQSKDPVPAGSGADNEGNFRIVIRFLDDHEAEFPSSSREAAACVSPGRKPWVAEGKGTSPVGTASLHESSRIPK